MVNGQQKVLRNSIIWCDSRAVKIGEQVFREIGEEICVSCLLKAPGSFAAAKLTRVKKNEPEIYKQVDKILLPGDLST